MNPSSWNGATYPEALPTASPEFQVIGAPHPRNRVPEQKAEESATPDEGASSPTESGAHEPKGASASGAESGRGPRGASGGQQGELAEVVGDLLGRLWRRGRVEVEKAAKRGRERLTLRQLRTDLDRMYQKLGKEARHLLEGGELDHPGIRRGVERIRELEERIAEAEDQMRAVGLDPADAGEGTEAAGPTADVSSAGDATPSSEG